MFSKYRDGGSVLICYECGHEMPNPNWFGNKRKEQKMEKATLKLNPKRIEQIIKEYYEKERNITVSGVTFNIGDVYDDLPASRPYKGFKDATLTVNL